MAPGAGAVTLIGGRIGRVLCCASVVMESPVPVHIRAAVVLNGALVFGEAQVPHEDAPGTYTRLRPGRGCDRSVPTYSVPNSAVSPGEAKRRAELLRWCHIDT